MSWPYRFYLTKDISPMNVDVNDTDKLFREGKEREDEKGEEDGGKEIAKKIYECMEDIVT